MGFFKGIAEKIDTSFASITGDEAKVATNMLKDVKLATKEALIEKAYDMGANGIVGIDYEGFQIGSIIVVAISGTAVVIEPITETEQG
jgi:uncharacterized protein YbjQ (UPF0145 family)